MSTIAYDGNILACDRGLFDNDRRVPSGCDKMIVETEYVLDPTHFAFNDMVAAELITAEDGYLGPVALAGSGTYEGTILLRDWWLGGAAPGHWPRHLQDGNGWTNLVVMGRDWIIEYGREPVLQTVRGMLSWGAGAEMAMGAMAAGASAELAVKICNRLHCYSGPGYQCADFSNGTRIWRKEGYSS